MFDLRKIGTKTNFESKNISSEKDFGLKKTDMIKLSKKIFGPKEIFDLKKIGTKKNFESKKNFE